MIKTLPPAIVDFHVHLFPEKGFEAIWKAFDQVYNAPVIHHLYHTECIDYLRMRGVETIVFSNYAHKRGFAKPMNQWNRHLLDTTENIYGFAAFHPEDDHALVDTAQILSHPKILGIKLHFLIQHFNADDSRFFPLYEMIIDRKKRLLMHIGTGPIGNEFTGIHQFEKILKRYPELPVTVPHMGGYEYKEFMNLLDAHKEIYLDTAYCFWPDHPGGFNLDNTWLEKYKDRILYGSDFPNIILPRKGEIQGLLTRNLSQEFYDRVFYANGKRLIDSILYSR